VTENPYTARTTPTVENEEVTTTLVTDPVTGDELVVQTSHAIVTVDPITGGRRFETTNRRIRAEDQRVIDGNEPVFSCACGKRLLTKHSVVFCAHCQLPVCAAHKRIANDGTTSVEVCPQCWRHGLFRRTTKRFIVWLSKI